MLKINEKPTERFDRLNKENKIEVEIRKNPTVGYSIDVGKDVGFWIGGYGVALTLWGAKRKAGEMVKELEKEILEYGRMIKGEDVVCKAEYDNVNGVWEF